MHTNVFGERDITRFIERTNEIARFEHGLGHRGGVSGVGAQIAVAQVGGCKQRRVPRQIKHDIAMRDRAVPRLTEGERRSR